MKCLIDVNIMESENGLSYEFRTSDGDIHNNDLHGDGTSSSLSHNHSHLLGVGGESTGRDSALLRSTITSTINNDGSDTIRIRRKRWFLIALTFGVLYPIFVVACMGLPTWWDNFTRNSIKDYQVNNPCIWELFQIHVFKYCYLVFILLFLFILLYLFYYIYFILFYFIL